MPRHIPRTGNPRSSALDELELVGIAPGSVGARCSVDLYVVAGLDVPAAAERDSGARIEGIVEEGPVHARQEEGDAARERERTLKPTPP